MTFTDPTGLLEDGGDGGDGGYGGGGGCDYGCGGYGGGSGGGGGPTGTGWGGNGDWSETNPYVPTMPDGSLDWLRLLSPGSAGGCGPIDPNCGYNATNGSSPCESNAKDCGSGGSFWSSLWAATIGFFRNPGDAAAKAATRQVPGAGNPTRVSPPRPNLTPGGDAAKTVDELRPNGKWWQELSEKIATLRDLVNDSTGTMNDILIMVKPGCGVPGAVPNPDSPNSVPGCT